MGPVSHVPSTSHRQVPTFVNYRSIVMDFVEFVDEPAVTVSDVLGTEALLASRPPFAHIRPISSASTDLACSSPLNFLYSSNATLMIRGQNKNAHTLIGARP